jgi:hypothetical protein
MSVRLFSKTSRGKDECTKEDIIHKREPTGINLFFSWPGVRAPRHRIGTTTLAFVAPVSSLKGQEGSKRPKGADCLFLRIQAEYFGTAITLSWLPFASPRCPMTEGWGSLEASLSTGNGNYPATTR